MKLLLLAVLSLLTLSACSGSTESKPTAAVAKADTMHEAIIAYLRKSLDDPTSYQPAAWGKATPGQQKNADSLVAQDAAAKTKIAFTYTKKAVGYSTPTGKRVFAENAAMDKHFQRLKDSLLHTYRYHELRASGYPYLPS
jgi:hypothetical protein